jgi:hypothetical protein
MFHLPRDYQLFDREVYNLPCLFLSEGLDLVGLFYHLQA